MKEFKRLSLIETFWKSY